jgi:hypothetical protein
MASLKPLQSPDGPVEVVTLDLLLRLDSLNKEHTSVQFCLNQLNKLALFSLFKGV